MKEFEFCDTGGRKKEEFGFDIESELLGTVIPEDALLVGLNIVDEDCDTCAEELESVGTNNGGSDKGKDVCEGGNILGADEPPGQLLSKFCVCVWGNAVDLASHSKEGAADEITEFDASPHVNVPLPLLNDEEISCVALSIVSVLKLLFE